MPVIAVLYKRVALSFEQLPRDVIAWGALLVGAIAIVLTIAIFRATEDRGGSAVTQRSASSSELVAATIAGAREFTAVGQDAKMINALLPFDRAPIEAARPFIIKSNDANYPRAMLCLRAAVYHEAGFEPLTGRRGVAQVILNRLRHPAFPKSVCGVVYQGVASPVCQFSFACDRARHRPVAATAWQESEQIAAAALAGYVESSVGTSTHYHANYVAPRWAPLLSKVSQTGTHIFYRWPGSWGRPAAFLRRYLGEEASEIGRAMELQAAIEGAMKTDGVRGVALLEVRDGKLAREAVRGVQKDGMPVRIGDVWEIGSDERLVLATLMARLVEKGMVSWETPLRSLFPDLAPYMGAKLETVTLEQLLSNPAILSKKGNLAFASDLAEGADPVIVQRAAYFENTINGAILNREPNTVPDLGFTIGVAAVEGITGRTYEDLLRTEIFEPLGLQSAGFVDVPKSKGKAAPERTPGTPHLLSQPAKIKMTLRDFATFLVDQNQGEVGTGKLLRTINYRTLRKLLFSLPTAPATSHPRVRSSPKLPHDSVAYFFIAGVNMRPNYRQFMVVTAIAKGQNRLVAIDQSLKTATSDLRR